MVEKNVALTKECVELQTKNADYLRINETLKKSNIELKERCEVLIKEMAESQTDFRNILEKHKADLSTAQNKMYEKNLRCENLDNTVRQLQAEVETVKKEKEQLKSKYEDIQVEVMKYINKNAELAKKNASLSQRCAELNEQLKTATASAAATAPKLAPAPVLEYKKPPQPLHIASSISKVDLEAARVISPPKRFEKIIEEQLEQAPAPEPFYLVQEQPLLTLHQMAPPKPPSPQKEPEWGAEWGAEKVSPVPEKASEPQPKPSEESEYDFGGQPIVTPEGDFEFEEKPQFATPVMEHPPTPFPEQATPAHYEPSPVLVPAPKKSLPQSPEKRLPALEAVLPPPPPEVKSPTPQQQKQSVEENEDFDLVKATTPIYEIHEEPKVSFSPLREPRKHTKSVVPDEFVTETITEEQKLSQSFYATEKQGDTGSPTQGQKMSKIEQERRYRNCLLNVQSKWYEDRWLEIGLIRAVNQPLKSAGYKIYFGNRTSNTTISITKFELIGYDSKGERFLRGE